MYLGKQHFLFQSPISQKIQFVFGRTAEQKGKKEGGWGEGIFALLRLELERFRFPLIKRKPKQKIFHLLLKEKNGGQKKIKNVMKKFLFWFAVAERRQAETHQLNYHALRAYDLVQSYHTRGACVSRGSVQKKLEFQPKGTAYKKGGESHFFYM